MSTADRAERPAESPGWRVFTLTQGDDGPMLAPPVVMTPAAITPYPAGPELPAYCDGPAVNRDRRPHEPPGQHCICGICFAWDRQSRGIIIALRQIPPSALVWAAGTPIPPIRPDPFRAASWRAAAMVLQTLWIPPEATGETAASLASRYGTDVLRWSRPARRKTGPRFNGLTPDQLAAAGASPRPATTEARPA